MKNKTLNRILVFVPSLILGLVLLNSFAQKDTEAVKVCVEKEINKKPPTEKIVLTSINGGQTWHQVGKDLPEIPKPVNVLETDGVLLATGQKGIKRSTDNGKTWEWVISEGGVGISIERIKGGFAAITYSTTTKSRRVRISSDGGITWQAIDEGLAPSMFISSIKEMGNNLICGHPDGIMLSTDRGRTWNKVANAVRSSEFKYVLAWNPRVPEPLYVFRIIATGNILYAVAETAGC